MAQNASNDVEETIKMLKEKPGYHAYVLMNNDGIVIKYENVEYEQAVMYAYHVLDLYSKAKRRLTKIMDVDNELECLRLRTKFHETIIAQHSRFTVVVLQLPNAGSQKENPLAAETTEKEGEEKAA